MFPYDTNMSGESIGKRKKLKKRKVPFQHPEAGKLFI